jgi:hypothetical protein
MKDGGQVMKDGGQVMNNATIVFIFVISRKNHEKTPFLPQI